MNQSRGATVVDNDEGGKATTIEVLVVHVI